MKKIIAVVLSVCILIAGEGPVLAQSFLQQSSRNARNLVRQEPKNFVLKSSQNPMHVRIPLLPEGTQSLVTPPLRPDVNVIQIQRQVERAAMKNAANLSFPQIVQHASQGKFEHLPTSILNVANTEQRLQLLRNIFVTAASQGKASADQVAQGRRFWRSELMLEGKKVSNNLPSLTTNNTQELLPVIHLLEDMAALSLLGQVGDKPLLKELMLNTQSTPLAPITATLWTRYLLVHHDIAELERFFSFTRGKFSTLQDGIVQVAQENGFYVTIPVSYNPELKASASVVSLLEDWGPVLKSAADPSAQATREWMKWYENSLFHPVENTTRNSAGNTPTTTTPSAVEASVAPAPQAETAAAPSSAEGPIASAFAAAARRFFEDPGKALALPNQTITPATQARAQVNPLAPLQAPAKVIPVTNPNPMLARLQRASLYAASFVMGLEVATPVIANFGTSFGLSLQDNILVAAATYTPYSLGALLSNQLKKVLGRKGSMNLGLVMMAAGFLGGVGWAGLDGSFAAQADTMTQFYKALACITLASTGGVFVHNSVGPIMTELNAGASDLVRQKRNAMTEFTRALGMASSFAFPYIATKMMGMDWSFTFALPIPLVVASLLGTSLIRLPNTRPVVTHAAHTAVNTGRSLWQKIKSNEYIRLFKEEKGAGPLLAGLAIMNGVEMCINNGFLFMLPSLTKDPSSQYLFGMAQFAAPFILGRYLAKRFLTWFPKRNLSIATGLAAVGASAAILPGIVDNVYALTSSLFLAETGISSLFTLSFARTAKNPATMDRLTTLIVASALSCAVGPMVFSNITQALINSGMGTSSATAAAMIGIPAALIILSSRLFRRVEQVGVETKSSLAKLMSFIKESISFPKFRRKRS